jgi:hypothetical protein
MSLKVPDRQVAFRFTILRDADDFRRARLCTERRNSRMTALVLIDELAN